MQWRQDRFFKALERTQDSIFKVPEQTNKQIETVNDNKVKNKPFR